jgi:hypothetical protein
LSNPFIPSIEADMTAGPLSAVPVAGELQGMEANASSTQQQAITDVDALHAVSIDILCMFLVAACVYEAAAPAWAAWAATIYCQTCAGSRLVLHALHHPPANAQLIVGCYHVM